MKTRVKIDYNDMAKVEKLFIKFNGYCNILGYLSKYGSMDTEIFDRKWEEAVEIGHALEQAKEEMDAKYHPDDGQPYVMYEFDFSSGDMIYKYD